MIVNEDFIWLHMPRTGGTSTTSAIRNWLLSCSAYPTLSKVQVDSDESNLKHDNLLTREMRVGPRPKSARICMNMRSLDSWLISNWKWANVQGFKVPLERYQRGEFFSWRLGQWCAADWWLEYMEWENITDFFWLDNLDADWSKFLLELYPEAPKIQMKRLNDLGKSPIAPLLEGARERNPIWTSLQERLSPQAAG